MDAGFWSLWDAQHRLLITRLTGDVSVEDVARWQAGLYQTLDQIEENSRFLLLSDLTDYAPHDMAAHKAMRTVVPLLLAAYGMRPALLDLFPEAEIAVTLTRSIRCCAHAHVHHDADKMAGYERALARPNQRFFDDVASARRWLLSFDSQ
jgi:hypothetical protein